VSVVAVRHGRIGVSVGNVIGSNVFNLMSVMGLAAALHPLSVNAAATTSRSGSSPCVRRCRPAGSPRGSRKAVRRLNANASRAGPHGSTMSRFGHSRAAGVAVSGSLLWMATPWVETVVLGDHPYVATTIDVPLFAG
jgi:hypothetical protein